MNLSYRRFYSVILCCLCLAPTVEASVVIEGTRMVYSASEREITVKMNNEGTEPALMQLWVDRGDPKTQPQDADAPFLITPPIFRLESKKGQSVRLVFTGEKLPQDRETLFWFNALEVPPMSADVERSSMQIAVRSRMKLFYRPDNLPGDAASAVNQVIWKSILVQGKYALRATNPGPYHVTFSKLELRAKGQRYDLGTGMIEPFSQKDFPVTGLNSNIVNSQLNYRAMSDYGIGVEESVLIH